MNDHHTNRVYVIKKTGVVLLFAGLLIAPSFLKKNPVTEFEKKLTDQEKSASLKLYGMYLDDVTSSTGVEFKHLPPKLDKKLDPILPLIASMGAAVAVSDYDKDGWNDFYVTNSAVSSMNSLYHNEKDGTFKDVAEELHVGNVNQEGTGVSMGAVWGDYNNDGYQDLFIYKWGRCLLFENLQGKGFREVTENTGIPGGLNANTAIWFDYNNDGFLDLFIGCYYSESIDLWHLKTTVIMPESFEYANNGGKNYLLRNNGNGTFTDVSKEAGITSTKWTLAAGAMDINQDGYQDLIVANDYGVSEIYMNEDGNHFIEKGKELGIGFSPKSGMNVSFGDVENNGKIGIYISNITEMGILLQGNNFWVPGESNHNLVYVNEARERGIELGGWSFGAQFGDLNNDGSQDLYLVNGFISGRKGSSYWYDYSKVTGGNKSIISDARNWPALKGRSLAGYQNDILWLNDGSGIFQEVTSRVSPQFSVDGRAVAFADLWNRGVLDMIISSQNSPLIILKNHVNPERNWIDFDLTGGKSNRDAIGARVDLYWGGKIQSQVVTAGIGFCSENQHRLHFGIGRQAAIDKAVIRWPSGLIQTITDPKPGMNHQVIESY